MVVMSAIALLPPAARAAVDDTAAKIPQITILQKNGQEGGTAEIMEKGAKKPRKITTHAVQGWTVRQGQGALILVVQKKSTGAKQYVLRYYDLDSGRRRTLGTVPISEGTVVEYALREDSWSFALTGKDLTTSQPVTMVGDVDAITGVIPGATSPTFNGESMSYVSMPSEERITLKTASLLGTELHYIYSLPKGAIGSAEYLQVFTNGSAMTMSGDGTIQKGRWQTDGQTLKLDVQGAQYSVPQASLKTVQGVPAGTRFTVRLLAPLSSRTTKEGMTVKAVAITPIMVDDELLVPAGTTIEGTVVQANDVGWGFKHETASLTIAWNQALFEDGHKVPITARVFQVDNAQENVTDQGKIQGIRSTGTPGHTAENGVLTFAGIDPIAYIFASASGSAVLGFAEPEILYHAGTELILEYVKPLLTSQTYPSWSFPSVNTQMARLELEHFVKGIPFRTKTKGTNKDSDLTNLIFMGSPDSLERAFKAAGWLPTDDLNAGSTFRTLKTLSGNQTYTQAPMSVLLLDERAPLFTLSKTTNTFFARHHIRIFPSTTMWNGLTVTTASSTQDIGIAFSMKQKTFIHVIDQHIDNERAKVINDLQFTGCVEYVDMVPRPWVPRDAYNSTGDRLLTDGQVAVLHIDRCDNPKTAVETAALPPARFERSTRNTALTLRNDFYRGNLIYQGISGGFKVRNYMKSSSELPQDYGTWQKTDASGAQYKGYGASPVLQQRAVRPASSPLTAEEKAEAARIKRDHKWDPPRYEFSLSGGYLHFREEDLSFVDTFLTSETNSTFYELDLYDQVNDGWTVGGTVTVNSWKHFSNEFSYFRQQGKYTLGTGVYQADFNNLSDPVDDDTLWASERVGLVTRQFEYNLLAHLRPPTSRWRPYIAAGPTFQLISLSDAPLKKPAGPFTLGLKNIGLIKAAFDFGNTPPLDGGGDFQFGVQYGAGIKYRVSPRVMLRADYRETWSQNPDIIKNSYEDFNAFFGDASYSSDVIVVKPEAKFFQDRFTLGIGFAF
jgi:opacity protein-like surface antigen